MNNGLRVFVDLDGVLVDFMTGAHKKYGLPYSYSDYPYPLGAWDCVPPSTAEMTTQEFWNGLDEEFWGTLDWMPDGKSILKTIERFVPKEQICLLTSPALNPESVSGKVIWVQENLPEYSRQLLVGPCKHFCANLNALLIDDADHNIAKFVAGGGMGILVPRKWNKEHKNDGSAREKLEIALDFLGDEIAGLH